MVFLVYHLEESSTVQVKGVGIGARLEGGKKWITSMLPRLVKDLLLGWHGSFVEMR
ncbi:hypothetical protein CK203_043991 [Vitis vinifera]|uniref:Uncharacterized protein n=1 Tax=Vitis vinifera TaxID=29760 RepID=A0A438HTE0_VITVI|nr:hypothetical protein CK203_043991 [Vitis vinifera]